MKKVILQFMLGIILLGTPTFLFEDTSLGIFDFCLRIEAFKESRLVAVLLFEGFDSYVPCLGIKEMDIPSVC